MKFITHKRMIDVAFTVDKVTRLGYTVLVSGRWVSKRGYFLGVSQDIRIKYSDLPSWFMSNDLTNWNEVIL